MPRSYNILFFLTLIISVVLLFGACKKESRGSCFMGAGKETTEKRSFDQEYFEIKAEDNVHIVLIQDSNNYIVLNGGENILPYVKTEIENGVLHIKNFTKCNFMKGYENDIKAELHFKSFKTLWNWGSGNITCLDTLFFDTLELNTQESIGKIELLIHNYKTKASIHTGVSDILLSGVSHDFLCYSRGTGFIRASNLKSEFAYGNNISALDFFVGECKILEALVQYKGNIYFKGNPDIRYSQMNGEGRIIKEN